MHCQACDALLSDFEATRRVKNTHQYIDLCNRCFKESYASTYPISERKDLATSRDFDEELSTEGSLEDYNDLGDYIVHRNTNE